MRTPSRPLHELKLEQGASISVFPRPNKLYMDSSRKPAVEVIR